MVPRPTFPQLLADLEAEHADLDGLVAPLPPGGWTTATPAAGWAVQDQISHLAFFDENAALALTDPERFRSEADAALAALAAGGDPMAAHLERGRALSGPQLLSWWRRARRDLLAASRGVALDARVPWYGPPMSPMSFLSARLMETWAHGQDVADALGATRTPTDRLAHIAHIGVRARPFSYVVHGLDDPGVPVRVELGAPSGGKWVWDEDAAGASVCGTALDFCLVVTQRRHLDDTSLVVEGDAAVGWMAIAQAFAGPPGPGRPPRGG
ncbi:MAG: TIGR03084 family metal-binding protein [Acidimicrobiales bacterium]